MSSNLALGFDQRQIMVILTTLVKGDFASLASTNSLNQPCIQHTLNTYSLYAQQANPLAEFSYTIESNGYIFSDLISIQPHGSFTVLSS